MSETRKYWSQHLAAIAAEGITTRGYAEREGLSADSLYYWRRRLKRDAAASGPPAAGRPTGRQLVPVQIMGRPPSGPACTLAIGPDVQLTLDQLPDPQWLASLAAATAGRGH
ncbi:IS66 family insertion sequence element accessory protein TnpA [Salinisphaera sp. RV14]|uniref:IS66 family insertion sequence element accessory protein TnpA n=1 Tax=Salinisphaera sp. RV14 TaxID=3454140 RepID=UPI003F86C005